MDPNENLKEQLELANHILEHIGDTDINDEAYRLAELVTTLDEWLHDKKGFLPKRWRRDTTGA